MRFAPLAGGSCRGDTGLLMWGGLCRGWAPPAPHSLARHCCRSLPAATSHLSGQGYAPDLAHFAAAPRVTTWSCHVDSSGIGGTCPEQQKRFAVSGWDPLFCCRKIQYVLSPFLSSCLPFFLLYSCLHFSPFSLYSLLKGAKKNDIIKSLFMIDRAALTLRPEAWLEAGEKQMMFWLIWENDFIFLPLISLCEIKRGKGKIEEFEFCTRADLGVFCPCV